MSHARTSRLIDDLRERIAHLEGSSARKAVVLRSAYLRSTTACQEEALSAERSTRSQAAVPVPWMARPPPCSPRG